MRPVILSYIAVVWLAATSCCQAQSSVGPMQAAAESYRQQNWQQAKQRFSSLIAEHPGDPIAAVAWFYLGESCVQLQEYSEAEKAFGNFLLLATEHPHREKARFRLVELAYLRGASDAVSLCEGFLKSYPKSPLRVEVLGFLGQLRLLRNEPELAERVFRSALDEFPDHRARDEHRLGLANALIRLRQTSEAAKLLREITSSRDDALAQRAKLLLALLDFEAGNKTAARGQLESILKAESLNRDELAEVRVWLARILTDAGELETATGHYVAAIESGLVEPWFSVALSEWSALQLNSGGSNKAAAEAALAQLLAWRDGPRQLKLERQQRELCEALQVRLNFEAANYEEAASLAEQYRVRYPAGPNYRQVLEIAGRVAYFRGLFEQGQAHFEELLDSPGLKPEEEANYSYQLASLLVAKKDFKAAKQVLAAADLESSSVTVAPQARRLRATIYDALGERQKTLEELERLVATLNHDTTGERRTALRQLLQSGLKAESFETVRRHWSEYAATPLSRDEMPLVQGVADLAYRNGDWALATNGYRELARADWELERQAAGWMGLAWTSLAEQKPDAARTAFEKVLDLPVPEAKKAEAYLPLAALLEQDEEFAAAIAMYQRAYTQIEDPNLVAVAKFKCAARMQELGGENVILEARDLLEQLENHPADSVPQDQISYRLAWIDSDLGREADSLIRYRKFLDQYPESKLWPDVAYRLAYAHLQRGEIDAAGKLLEQVDGHLLPVELSERLGFLRGRLHAARGEWGSAENVMRDLAAATDDTRLQERAIYWQAEACFQKGQMSQTAVLFEQILNRASSTLEPNDLENAALRRAEAKLAGDDWAGALNAVELARTIRARREAKHAWPELELVLGRALFAGGRLSESIKAFEEVIASATRGADSAAQAQWRIGEALLLQERFEEALTAYTNTIDRYSSPQWRGAAMLQSGKCYERLGNSPNALQVYQQLLKEYPESEFAVQARRRIESVERRARAEELIRR